MIITSLSGTTEYLTDYKDLTRTQKVNLERTLSFTVMQTERNTYSFPLVAEESIVEYDGVQYVINLLEKKMSGTSPIKVVKAVHKMFPSLIDNYIYTTQTGTFTLTSALSFALAGTEYTFEVQGSFSSQSFVNFGNDNSLSLLNKLLDSFGAEFDVTGTHLILVNQIGVSTDFQFRYQYNTKTIGSTIDTSQLATYIKGFGAQDANENYLATAEYTSPNAAIFGIRHASPVQDSRFTDNASLLAYCQQQLKDVPTISIDIEFVELQNAGYPYGTVGLGDRWYVIYEPLGVDLTARIVEITDYPESFKSPKVTLANLLPNMPNLMFHVKSNIASLQSTTNTQTGSITTLQSSTATNTSNITTNTNNIATNTTNITDLQTRMTTQETNNIFLQFVKHYPGAYRTHGIAATNSASNIVSIANGLDAYPFKPYEIFTCDYMGIYVSTAAAGGLVTLGLYSDNNGYPGTLLGQTATLDCSTVGWKEATFSNGDKSVTAGTLYWVARYTNNAITFNGIHCNVANPVPSPPSLTSSTVNMTTGGGIIGLRYNSGTFGSTGTMPSTFPTTASGATYIDRNTSASPWIRRKVGT